MQLGLHFPFCNFLVLVANQILFQIALHRGIVKSNLNFFIEPNLNKALLDILYDFRSNKYDNFLEEYFSIGKANFERIINLFLNKFNER